MFCKYVIPREGVERNVKLPANLVDVAAIEPVIPREGVESNLYWLCSHHVICIMKVIPREGVESRRRPPRPPSGMRGRVIPREGVESSL